MQKNAVILLSGGLDSATVLAMVKSIGFQIYCLSFSYGQRHIAELECAKRLIAHLGPVARHVVAAIDLRVFGKSALTDTIEVPKHEHLDHIDYRDQIPLTYVPARNTIFLSHALGYAEVVGANHIFIGANQIDYSNYPDCRAEYLKAYETMANLATARGVGGEKIHIVAPLLHMRKAEIIQKGVELGVDYSLTSSCYDVRDGVYACGKCDACLMRKNAFHSIGLQDPIQYANND